MFLGNLTVVLQTQDLENSFFWAYKKLFRLLLRVVVSRIVFRAEVFQSKRLDRGYLRDVLAGFRPVEMGRVARENDHGAGRNGFQSTSSDKMVLKTSCPSW